MQKMPLCTIMKLFRKGFDSLFIPPPPPKVASDEEALIQVWEAVGRDISSATEAYEKEQEEKNKKE